MAEAFGAKVAPHQCSGPIAHVASLNAMSVCRNFLIQEWEAADDRVFQEMTDGAYPVQRDGYVELSERPGLGLEVNLAEFQTVWRIHRNRHTRAKPPCRTGHRFSWPVPADEPDPPIDYWDTPFREKQLR